jgi:hypothetical protein
MSIVKDFSQAHAKNPPGLSAGGYISASNEQCAHLRGIPCQKQDDKVRASVFKEQRKTQAWEAHA